MSVEPELLWPGAALLVLLGTAAGLCVRCSRPGARRSEKIYEQRTPQENRQSFAVARTYSLVRPAWPGPLMDMTPDVAPTRTDKLLHFSTPLEGSTRDSDTAYIDPIATDYYNWGCFKKSAEDEEDTNSYENVLICKPRTMESGCPCVPPGGEETEDYQNSAAIHQWRESRRAVGSPDEDAGEPDYVNGDVTAAREA